MIGIWVLSKAYTAPGGEFPVAWSYGHNHVATGYQDNGFGLVWLTLDAQQLEFLRSGTDPNVAVVGNEWDTPPQLLLDTYATQLGTGTYNLVGQVISKLSETEPRILTAKDAFKY